MDSFIARQPIFDDHQKVYGYELLFRSGLDNVFRSSDPDQATSRVLTDSLSLFSMSTLTGGKRGFINITRDILLKVYLFLDEIKNALLGADSSLANIYQLVLAYEKGEWEKLAKQRLQLGMNEALPPRLFLAAVEWGHKCFQEERQGLI